MTLKAILRPHLAELSAALLCTGAASGLLLLIPSWLKRIIQAILPQNDPWLLARHLALGLVLVVAIQVSLFGKDFIRLRLGHQLGAEMRQRLFEKILFMPLHLMPEQRSGDLVSRLTNDITVLEDGLMKGLFRFIPHAIMLVCLTGLMFYHSWLLSLITLFFIAPVGFVIYFFARKIRRRAKVSQEQLALINNLAEESIRGAKEIKAFDQEDQVGQRFFERSQGALKAFIAQDWLTALNPVIVLLVTVCCIFVLVFVCAWLVSRGLLVMGSLVAFLTSLALAFSPLQEVTRSVAFIGKVYAVLDRFDEILLASQEKREHERLPALPTIKGNIRLQGIHFAYEEKGGFALADIDLEIAAKETVAFVGPSGAGKTTLVSLILRFLQPDAGAVLIDGHDIRAYSLESLRRQVGLVPQEPVLFDGTLFENLAFARPGASGTDILAAARAAHVEEFAEKLPRGYETPIGQYGSKLSVGQRQRIAIARALLVDPRILILDEPTSALDAQSEHFIRDSLDKLCKEKTTLIIAHRMSTIRSADRIVVLHDGRIEEIGSHEELLQKEGLYHKLFCYQDFY